MTFNILKINQRFRRIGEKILAMRWLLLTLVVILTGIAFVGIQKVEINSSWDGWFLKDDPLVRAKDTFEEIFGNSDDAAVLVEADDVFSHDTLRMIRELSTEFENNVPYVDKVVSLTEFEFSQGTDDGMRISNLVADEIPTAKEELELIRTKAFSKKNLVNKLFSDNSKETLIHIRLKEVPESFKEEQKAKGKDYRWVMGKEINRILHQEKYKKYSLKETGMPVVTFDKTNYFMKEAGLIILLAIGATILVLILLLRSLRGVVVPLLTTISAIFICYGAMGILNMKIDAMMITIPVYLSLAVSIGYSIHIFNFFKRHFDETGNRKEAILYAVEFTGWPLFFTALTTIGCMLSFNFTNITTIRWVGNASAIMVAVVYLFVMVLNPVLLSFGKDREPAKVKKVKSKFCWSDAFFEKLSNTVIANSKVIAVIAVILIGVLGYGMKYIYTDFVPFKSFGLKVPYVKRMYDITHSKIGSMYSYNLTLEFDEKGKTRDPEVLKRFEKLESEIKKLALTKNTMSILDIIKDMNRTLHGDEEKYYRIPDNRKFVSQLLLLYENSGGKDAEYWTDYDYTILRLFVNMSEFQAKQIEKELGIIETLAKKIFPDAITSGRSSS